MIKNEKCQYCNSENIKICDDDEQSIFFFCNGCSNYFKRSKAVMSASATPRTDFKEYTLGYGAEMVSETPWTDERERVGKIRSSSAVMGVVPAVYVRELERKLASTEIELEQARAETERLKEATPELTKKDQQSSHKYFVHVDEQKTLIKQMLGTLQCCRDKFSEYVKIHKAKIPEFQPAVFPSMSADTEEKVKRNQDMVDLCDAAIEAAKGGK